MVTHSPTLTSILSWAASRAAGPRALYIQRHGLHAENAGGRLPRRGQLQSGLQTRACDHPGRLHGNDLGDQQPRECKGGWIGPPQYPETT